jgi:membrane-associated phospholipid phosphatase
MIRTVITLLLVSAGIRAQVSAPPRGTAGESPNAVVQWNRNLLAIVRTPGAQPATIHPTRSFAMMHAAIYDAVNSVDRTHHSYFAQVNGVSRHASLQAAAAAAAHEVLIALYPTFQSTLDAELEQSLGQVPDGPHKDQGIATGKLVADEIVALRSADGSTVAPPPFVFGNAPGNFQSTPPNFPKPQFTEWSKVTPFALQQASQFRPGPPPALTSNSYTNAFNEVKSFGIANSTTATTDQALTGRFWNGAIQNYWNEIAQIAAIINALTTAQSARLFALLNLSFADGVIAFYDAKYTYDFWRPVTAIRADDTNNNPDIIADPNWLPEVGNTTPDPSYPGAHAVISAAGAVVLASVLGTDQFNFNVTSEVLAGVQRSFTAFSAAAEEATLSRIFAGVHFRTDLTTGQQLGTEVANFVAGNFLTAESQSRHERFDTGESGDSR